MSRVNEKKSKNPFLISMIQELMQFVENSKKALEALERKNMKESESQQV